MPTPFSITIIIDAPIETVWRKLVDWQSQSDWMAMTRVHASHNGADDSGIGTMISAFTGVGRFGIEDAMRVTQWQPPTFCAVNHYGRWIKGIGEFTLESIENRELNSISTSFHWYEEIEGSPLLLNILKPGILTAVYFSLRKFARTCANSQH